MTDIDALAAERPCRHYWVEFDEAEYWPDHGGIETGECIFLTGWKCTKCGDEVTTTGDRPND